MTMARYVNGPRWAVQNVPGSAVNAGDVVVQGNLSLVSDVDNPVGTGTSIIQSALYVGGIYQVAADAAYPVGQPVWWNPATSQVTGAPTPTTVPFGFIVAGPTGLVSDGGPTGAGSYCYALHDPDMVGISLPRVSSVNALTAHAGGGQANATPILAQIARFTTVATAGDSGLLPAAGPGLEVTVTNAAAANSMNVFPNTGDQINSLGANAAFALAAGKTATFFSTVAGQWHSILSA
jgi:predicted RecA/RadA family phage recombinase